MSMKLDGISLIRLYNWMGSLKYGYKIEWDFINMSIKLYGIS